MLGLDYAMGILRILGKADLAETGAKPGCLATAPGFADLPDKRFGLRPDQSGLGRQRRGRIAQFPARHQNARIWAYSSSRVAIVWSRVARDLRTCGLAHEVEGVEGYQENSPGEAPALQDVKLSK